MRNLILLGDWAPKHNTVKANIKLIGDNSGYCIANLEGPILPSMDGYTARNKAGPSIYSKSLPDQDNAYIFSLSNNHIMDYGYSGLLSTKEKLLTKNYQYFGAGDRLCPKMSVKV